MRTRQTMTISLPPQMVKEVERMRKVEHRTRSELVREALRAYISGRFTVVRASAAEVRALKRGRREHARGEYVTLDQLLHAMGSRSRPVSRKRA